MIRKCSACQRYSNGNVPPSENRPCVALPENEMNCQNIESLESGILIGENTMGSSRVGFTKSLTYTSLTTIIAKIGPTRPSPDHQARDTIAVRRGQEPITCTSMTKSTRVQYPL